MFLYKTIDFAELLRVQIADVTDLLSEKEISLFVDIPDKILCEADPAQMERAIQNVLVNAIRYSPNGEAIYVSLSRYGFSVSGKVVSGGEGFRGFSKMVYSVSEMRPSLPRS